MKVSDQQSETTWIAVQRELGFLTDKVTQLECQETGEVLFPEHVNRLEAEARAARLAVEALAFLVEFYEVGGNGEGWTLEQVVAKAREALSAIAELNQGGQHAE